MMEVADLIYQKQIECITKRGYEPKFVYLGKVEMDSLLCWAKDTCGYKTKYSADSGIEVLGLKCFKVNTENHLNVV